VRRGQVSVTDGVTVLSAGAAGTDALHIACELVFQVSPLFTLVMPSQKISRETIQVLASFS